MKTKQTYILIFILSLMFLLSACGGKVTGIDSPLEVGDVQLQITSVKLQNTVDIGQQVLHPASAEDTILSITATTSTENPDLKVSVTDKGGRTDTPSVTESTFRKDKSTLTWYFGVSREADSFILQLPGEIVVPLDSMLGE